MGETHILIGLARTYDMLNALLRGVSFYKMPGSSGSSFDILCTALFASFCSFSGSHLSDPWESRPRKVLQYDAVNSEAIACLASHHFYTDQPELALRFYRRMLQNGVVSAEPWQILNAVQRRPIRCIRLIQGALEQHGSLLLLRWAVRPDPQLLRASSDAGGR